MANYVESHVGIKKFISIHTGFNGILKMRYQDFLVNEIDMDETVLRLNSLSYDEPVEVNLEYTEKVTLGLSFQNVILLG